MAMSARQVLKLEFSFRSFDRNVEKMRRELTDVEAEKVLLTGASAYVTSAARHTPPSLGQPTIEPVYYADGFFQTPTNAVQPRGRRAVYRLRDLARSREVKNRAEYGEKLRQGYEYMVKIFRGRRPVRIYARDEAEAARYAHETYRGLTRAAWGLSFASIAGKVPAAFRKYLSQRPELSRMAHLNEVTLDKRAMRVTVINRVIPEGAGYLPSTDVNASIAAVRSMDDRLNKFFKRKREL